MPTWIYGDLERWHHVSFLKSRKTMQILLDLRREALEPEKLDTLIRVVEEDLGYLVYHVTERAKRELSAASTAEVTLRHEGATLFSGSVARPEFEAWVAEELASIEACVDRLLGRAGAERVDRVFLTGGSSLVPSVRRIFERRFGPERIRTGAELTSVANGLALCAARSTA